MFLAGLWVLWTYLLSPPDPPSRTLLHVCCCPGSGTFGFSLLADTYALNPTTLRLNHTYVAYLLHLATCFATRVLKKPSAPGTLTPRPKTAAPPPKGAFDLCITDVFQASFAVWPSGSVCIRYSSGKGEDIVAALQHDP